MHDFNRTGTQRRISRRGVLIGTCAAATPVWSCSFLSTDPSSGAEDAEPEDRGRREAPALAAAAESGELPALDERLPDDPLVVQPNDRAGRYGGTWRTALLGTSDTAWLDRTVDYESLVRWSVDWSDIIPNVAATWDREEGGRRYVFTLRPGMKWSDGEPFTADDIAFAYNDVLLNSEIYPVPPRFVLAGSEPATLDKVDDHTIAFTFAEPNTFFPEDLCYQGRPLCSYPLH